MSYEFLVFIVVANVLATLALWRRTKPETLKKKFLHSLLRTKPIEPKHNAPNHIGDDHPSLASDTDRSFFSDFVAFGELVNRWLSDEEFGGPWRIQELPSTDLRLAYSDSPQFGRRYHIFYNQQQIGEMEVSAGYPYTQSERNVYVDLELEWVRLLSFGRLIGFLSDIASQIQTDNKHLEMQSYIHRAVMEVMWKSVAIPEYDLGTDYGRLELRLSGKADWYFRQLEARNGVAD